MKKAARLLGWIVAWVLASGAMLWSLAAVAYDFPRAPFPFAATLGAGLLVAALYLWALVSKRGLWRKLGAVFSVFALVLAWWLTLKPSNDRPWQADVDRTAWAEIHGDEVTLKNVRDCDYRSETDFTPRWLTRTVHLSRITGIDLAINYWGSPWMAHPILSFQFSDAPPVCFSIETRKEIGETYSAIGGFFRQFELIYIVSNESDVLRVRTNFRTGEDVYLYRLNVSADGAREQFSDYLMALNALRDHPRWYNAATTNCTTSIRQQRAADKRRPFDWRMLLNGKGDEMLFEQGQVVTGGLPFDKLKACSLINEAARQSNEAEGYSSRIRAQSPVFR